MLKFIASLWLITIWSVLAPISLHAASPALTLAEDVIDGKLSFESLFPTEKAKTDFLELPENKLVISRLRKISQDSLYRSFNSRLALRYLLSHHCFYRNLERLSECIDRYHIRHEIFEARSAREEFNTNFFHEWTLFIFARDQNLHRFLMGRYIDTLAASIPFFEQDASWDRLAHYELLLSDVLSEESHSYSLSIRRGNLLRDYILRQWKKPPEERDLDHIRFVLTGIVTQDEYFEFQELSEIFNYLLEALEEKSASLHFNLLSNFLSKYRLKWPLTIRQVVYRQRLNALVSRCKGSYCESIKTQHALNSVLDLQHSDPRLAERTMKEVVSDLSKSKDRLQRLLARLLPDTLRLGQARLRGDFVTMFETIPRVRKWFETAEKEDELAILYYGLFETVLLRDELSLGLVEDVLARIDIVLNKINAIKRDYDPVHHALIQRSVTSLEGVKLNAQQTKLTGKLSKVQTEKESNFSVWLDDDPLVGPLILAFDFIRSKDLKNAAFQLDKSISTYIEHIENELSAPNFLLEKQFFILDELLQHLEREPNIDPTITRPDLIKRLTLNYATLGQIVNARNISLLLADYKDFAGLKSISPRVSVLFSKLYLNSIQAAKAEFIKSGYREQSLRIIALDTDWVRETANFFVEKNLSRSALSALTILREQAHADYLSDKTRSKVLGSTVELDTAESDYLRRFKLKLTEIDILSAQFFTSKSSSKEEITGLLRQAYQDIEEYIFELDRAPATAESSAVTLDKKSSRYIHAQIPRGQALLVFSVQADHTMIFLYTESRFRSISVAIDRNQLRRLSYEIYVALEGRSERYRDSIGRLSKYFESSIAELFEGSLSNEIVNLSIAPDDALGILPPNIYIGRPLKRLSQLNLQVLSPNYDGSKTTSRKSRFDFFGVINTGGRFPSLPGVLSEAKFLQERIFRDKEDRARFFLNEKVTREQLKRSFSSETQRIHIASHFDLRADRDSETGIVLGRGEIFSVSDIRKSTLDLSGLRLLTLAACETAIGLEANLSGSKAFNGLATEFVRAGAQFVVASLWRVSDESSAAFMQLFYFFLQYEGLPPGVALHRTQISFEQGIEKLDTAQASRIRAQLGDVFISRLSKYSHPFHWAAYVGVSGGLQ